MSYTYGRAFKHVPHTFYLLIKYCIIETCYLSIPVFCFYSAYAFVAPPLFVSKKFIRAFFLFLFVFAGAVVLRYSLEYFFFLPVLGFDNYNGHPWPAYDFISNVFFYYFPRYFVYGLMYFFAENWYKTRHLQQALQKERSAAELAFLRSQLNPHFLFNTLNDIYSLAYQKSEQTPDALLKLSELLRYMLREGNEDIVSLGQEVRYLESLVKLQQISCKSNAFIKFYPVGVIDEQKVASLLFVSFVENAFKHGIINDPRNPVNISLLADPGEIRFSISNKINDAQKDSTGGIGLNNVRRRLELIYPGKHTLNISEANNFYKVNLVIKTK